MDDKQISCQLEQAISILNFEMLTLKYFNILIRTTNLSDLFCGYCQLETLHKKYKWEFKFLLLQCTRIYVHLEK